MQTVTRYAFAALGLLLLQITIQAAMAQTWPARPLRFVVPANPGTSSDILTRVIFEPVGQVLGQAIIVESRPGAAGTIALESVAKSTPEGQVFAIPSLGSLGIASTLYKNLHYDPLKDLAGVAGLTSAPNVLAVTKSFPANTVKELIDQAKSHPGKFNFAAAGGFGTSFHLAWVNFSNLVGINVVTVPFKSGSDTAQALATGDVQIAMNALNALQPQIIDGTLRPLVVTSPKRMPSLPAVPTGTELGLPGLDVVSWFGLVTRGGTSQSIIDRMSAETLRSLSNPDVIEKLARLGFDPFPMSATQFDAFYHQEIARWAPVVKSTGLSAE